MVETSAKLKENSLNNSRIIASVNTSATANVPNVLTLELIESF